MDPNTAACLDNAGVHRVHQHQSGIPDPEWTASPNNRGRDGGPLDDRLVGELTALWLDPGLGRRG